MLPEGADGIGARSVSGATPLRWADLYGPKGARGYAGCPLGGSGLDIRAANTKWANLFWTHFCGF